MFGFNTKEIFQQKITDLVHVLFASYMIGMALFYVIKWIHPHIKKRADAYYKQKSNFKPSSKYSIVFNERCKNEKNRVTLNSKIEDEMVGDGIWNEFEHLKTLLGMADNPPRAVFDSLSEMKINMMSDSEFENALNLGNFLRKLNKRNSSCEVQTNITINPKMKIDYSCPELLSFDLIPERVIKTTNSSDSFKSVSSKKSETLKSELEQIISELEGNDDSLQSQIDEDKIIQKLQNYLKSSLANSDVSSSFEQSTNQAQESRLLEVAIAEFEKELKPIKEQIQILKEYFSGELACKQPNSIGPFSDLTSSFTESGTLLESVSGTTTSSTGSHSFFSSYHIISATSFGSVDKNSKCDIKLDKTTFRNIHKTKQYHKLSSFKGTSNLKEIPKSPEKHKSKKRSPIAEMYVKLSQCKSQTSSMVRNKREKVTSNDAGVTYRIDLNVNLTGANTSKCQKSKPLKERTIQPLTSDPDEILGKPSDTHICLRPTIK